MADEPDLDADLGAQLIARLQSEDGLTLIETAIATGILLVVMAGLLSMAALATNYTENHGHLEARTTEYAQDKMEQMLALAYSDEASDTVTFPAAALGGTGLKVGGSADPAAPVDLYIDWLAQDGTLLGGGTTAPANWFYKRVWEVTCAVSPCSDTSPTTGVKQLKVLATVRSALGGAMVPRSTVVALKACQF